jgi:2-iminobutanoate/2-iminopropanoate deaminase
MTTLANTRRPRSPALLQDRVEWAFQSSFLSDDQPESPRKGNRSMTDPIFITDVPGYPASHSPYSHAVVANGFVFVSGQIAVRPGGGPTDVVGSTIEEQTTQALRNVQTVLEAAGSSIDRAVKLTVLLAKPEHMKGMNAAYAQFFKGPKPARAIAKLGVEMPGILISIEAIALEGNRS